MEMDYLKYICNFIFRSRSRMDTTWVSGTQDTGSIPVEITICNLFEGNSLKMVANTVDFKFKLWRLIHLIMN
ncbi:MAG: hypothetical protein RLZZ417_437 [Bacteroidota bacterium]|jgi:hypothetical protein